MPIDPGAGERLARRVSELYAESELSLLRRIAKALGQGLDAPAWASNKLAELDLVRAQMGLELTALDLAAGEAVRSTIALAFQSGQALAVADLDALSIDIRMPPARAAAIQQIAEETLGVISSVRPAALRAATDLYQSVVGEAAATVITGATTRRGAAQSALDRFTANGITGFKDSAGRNWSMTSYTEMAVRTGAGNAAVQGHLDQLTANGLDLVIISDAPRECPLCRPFEGKILSIGGFVAGSIDRPDVAGDGTVAVQVYSTVGDARAAGLWHPNCRHSASAYLPGATVLKAPTAEPAAYEAGQQQRSIERGIRRAKLRSATALDDSARLTADGRVRMLQAKMRAHLEANPTLRRKSAREQIGRAT